MEVESRWQTPRAGCHGVRGFTLIELMLAIAVASILTMVALNTYRNHVEEAKIKASIADMTRIDAAIARYQFDENQLPVSLAEIFSPVPKDAWGNPFRYLRLRPASRGSRGQARKDHNLVPINSDYDLYSSGPDGRSVAPLTGRASRDDIVRGNNGGYIGKAADY